MIKGLEHLCGEKTRTEELNTYSLAETTKKGLDNSTKEEEERSVHKKGKKESTPC